MTKILSTKDYSIFKKNEFNRPIDKNNLDGICETLSKSNLLKYNPIIVDENMQIIDGQHRLEACKRLKLEVSYVVMEKGQPNDIITLNKNMKKWSSADYVNYWAANGNDSYKFILELANTYKFPVTSIVKFLSIKKQEFTAGKMSLTKEKKIFLSNLFSQIFMVADTFHNKIIASDTSKSWIYSSCSLRALANLLQHPAIGPTELLEKILICSMGMMRKSNCSQYCDMYLSAWNYKKHTKIPIEEVMDT